MGADLEKLDSAPVKPGVEDPPSDTAKESLGPGFSMMMRSLRKRNSKTTRRQLRGGVTIAPRGTKSNRLETPLLTDIG